MKTEMSVSIHHDRDKISISTLLLIAVHMTSEDDETMFLISDRYKRNQ